MHTQNISTLSIRCIASAVLAIAGTSVAAAGAASEAQSRYEQERARCMSGQSGQAQDTCLKEAVNAREAAKKGDLASGEGKLRKNARDRCDVLTGDDQRDCIARSRGNGNSASGAAIVTPEGAAAISKRNSTSGSVKGGGVLRETVTRETVMGAPIPASAASR